MADRGRGHGRGWRRGWGRRRCPVLKLGRRRRRSAESAAKGAGAASLSPYRSSLPRGHGLSANRLRGWGRRSRFCCCCCCRRHCLALCPPPRLPAAGSSRGAWVSEGRRDGSRRWVLCARAQPQGPGPAVRLPVLASYVGRVSPPTASVSLPSDRPHPLWLWAPASRNRVLGQLNHTVAHAPRVCAPLSVHALRVPQVSMSPACSRVPYVCPCAPRAT